MATMQRTLFDLLGGFLVHGVFFGRYSGSCWWEPNRF